MEDGNIGVISVVASTVVAVAALLTNVVTTWVDRRHQRQLAAEAREAVDRDLAREALRELTEWALRLDDALRGPDRDTWYEATNRGHDLTARLVLYAPADVAEALNRLDDSFWDFDTHAAFDEATAIAEMVRLKEEAIDAGNFDEAARQRHDEVEARRRMAQATASVQEAITGLRTAIQSHALILQPREGPTPGWIGRTRGWVTGRPV